MTMTMKPATVRWLDEQTPEWQAHLLRRYCHRLRADGHPLEEIEIGLRDILAYVRKGHHLGYRSGHNGIYIYIYTDEQRGRINNA